jgi:hypothetical protein
MSKKPQTTMDKVRAAILKTSGPGSLYRWLRLNHDEFAEAIAQVRRPNWRAITAALQEEELQDADGKSPTPERVRQTWLAVRKDVAAATSGGRSQDKSTSTLQADPAEPQPAAGPPPVRVLDDGRPAKPKSSFDKDEFLKGMKRPWER